jgi:hypothetical protein
MPTSVIQDPEPTTTDGFTPTGIIAIQEAFDQLGQPATPPAIEPVPSREERIDSLYLQLGTTRAESEAKWAAERKREETLERQELPSPSEPTTILTPKALRPLKEGREVPASSVKRKRKQNPNDKRTGWQFKQPHVRKKIDIWNEAQAYQTRVDKRKRYEQRRKDLRPYARPLNFSTRHPNGLPKNHYERWYSIDGLEALRQSGIRRARENAQTRHSPTAGLPGLKQYENGHFRSSAESYTAAFLTVSGLNHEYAETSGAPAARSATINLQRTFRQDDFHVDMGSKKYKIQLKGPGSLFKRFQKLIGPSGAEKQFRRYRSDLLNLINEDVINQLELSLGLDVREQLLCSTASFKFWIRDLDNLPKPESVERLYRRESNRFRRYLYKFAEAIFPREMQVIDRAVELFLSVPKSELTDEPQIIVDFYIECLVHAMDELAYDNHVRSIHRDFYRRRKNVKRLRSLLPRRFKPTKP